jgi:acyl-coenzyme A synthetase/AMP-(fatty) acid ligase
MNKNLIWHHSIFLPPESNKLFESLPKSLGEVVSKHSNSPAVILEGKIYTFHDLASRVAGLSDEINEFAHLVGPVALIQKFGLDAIAAWFACLLSGKPFLLLEPDHPTARLIELIKASGCSLALVDDSTSPLLADLPEIVQLISDGRYGRMVQDKGLHAEEPAMIFPTSGTTGDPKLITYATTTIQLKVQSSIKLMRITHGTRVMIAGSHSNYGFLHHALVFLLSGSAVCLANVKISGFDAILNAISNLGVRHIRFTPSLFRKLAVLPKAKKALRLLNAVRFSGEPLLESDLKLSQSVLNPDCLIQNIYGSTESALFIWSSTDKNSLDLDPTVPIGRIYPLSSYAIRPIEDADGDNIKGELLIRSKFHALGDFKEGIIDKERFPLLEGSTDDRIYATGDIVQQLPDGNLIHLGRLRRMVKIRGNRVFLAEVEQHLRTIRGVTGAAVVDRVEQDNIVLYGFITTNATVLTTEDLRSQLSARLPDFMVPRKIETVAQIPLMAGGKVDYQALRTLISTPDLLADLAANPDADFMRLIKVWDSLLWAGAHQHNSDFFSLGGDSLSFMLLLVKVEEIFGKSISKQELETNCTLQHLAVVLGIDAPDSQPIKKYKTIEIRCLWTSAISPSKGIALSTPGFGGVSNAYPFHRAGFFQDHDIWALEFPIQEGNMLQANRWRIAALEIVQGIQEGIIPAPRILFGFSFAGGLAWLVGCLLAGSPHCPDFVVMVDAPPLHRRYKLRYETLKNAVKNVSNMQLPSAIHMRRSPLDHVDIFSRYKREWNQSDNILRLIDFPTVSHLDMINSDLLALAKDLVNPFLNKKENNFHWITILSGSNIIGCHIFYAFNGSLISLQKVKDELKKPTDRILTDQLIVLAVLMYKANNLISSQELLRIAIKKMPDSGTVNFINRRIRHSDRLLFSSNHPKIYPSSIVALEKKLASSNQNTNRSKLFVIKMLYFYLDLAYAFLVSRCSRTYKKLTHNLNKNQEPKDI